MTEPYLGEIRMFSGNFAPRNWALCNGQMVAVNDYTALFSLIGTTYGGDGRTTFALPELRGRIPVHWNKDNDTLPYHHMGASFGYETITLSVSNIPTHNHALQASLNTAASSNPGNDVLASHGTEDFPYAEAPNDPSRYQTMSSSTLASSGGGQSHSNMMPYQCINFIIAMQGIYPERS